MSIVTGTPETSAEHHPVLGFLNELVALIIPLGLIVLGVIVLGWEAIAWTGALVWGAVAALAMSLTIAIGRSIGITTMNLLDLLGSLIAPRGTGASWFVGLLIHMATGAVLAVAGAYSIVLLGFEVTWLSAGIWAAFVSLLALLMMSSLGVVHPKIRRHEQVDPGPAAVHFGALTPVGVVLAHLVYGAVLGLLYNAWPLA